MEKSYTLGFLQITFGNAGLVGADIWFGMERSFTANHQLYKNRKSLARFVEMENPTVEPERLFRILREGVTQ